MANKKDADYEVGFGKPPKEHRFPKGVSGNPSGRPRGRTVNKSTADMLLEFLDEKVTVRTSDGKKKRMSRWELTFQKYAMKLVSQGGFLTLENLLEHYRVKY